MTSQTFTYDYENSYTELINKIIVKLIDVYKKNDDFDETWFYDSKDSFIQEYVESRPEEAKEVIDKYGIFKAIRYYNEYGSYGHGGFEIEDDDMTCYEVLYYAFIDKFVNERKNEIIEKVREKIKNDNKKPFHYQYEESYEELVDQIINDYYNEEKHKGDDTWYYDALHEVIDSYVCRYDYEAKEVIDKYGVFDAISDYNDAGFGDFEIDKSATKNYMTLYYILIYNFIMDNYRERLESVSTKDE